MDQKQQRRIVREAERLVRQHQHAFDPLQGLDERSSKEAWRAALGEIERHIQESEDGVLRLGFLAGSRSVVRSVNTARNIYAAFKRQVEGRRS
jgi:hypothetical protein